MPLVAAALYCSVVLLLVIFTLPSAKVMVFSSGVEPVMILLLPDLPEMYFPLADCTDQPPVMGAMVNAYLA